MSVCMYAREGNQFNVGILSLLAISAPFQLVSAGPFPDDLPYHGHSTSQ